MPFNKITTTKVKQQKYQQEKTQGSLKTDANSFNTFWENCQT